MMNLIAKKRPIKHNHNMRLKRILIAFVVLITTISAIGLAPIALADTSTPPVDVEPSNRQEKAFIACPLDTPVGWILCAIGDFLSSGTDLSFKILKSDFFGLKVDPRFLTNASTASTWSVFRDFANSLAAVIFLIMIFSYFTGKLMSAYDIKRLLPKFLVGIILINLSFVICQTLVEASNIIGNGVYELFEGASNNVWQRAEEGGKVDTTVRDVLSQVLTAPVGGAVVTGAVAAGLFFTSTKASLYSVMMPIVLMIGVIVFSLVVILSIRQIVVMMAVILSPIAFASNILPGTESFYKMWKKFFSTSLVMYPIIAILFGGGVFAGKIVSKSAVDQSDFLMALLGIFLEVAPMLYAPSLIRNTMASMPMMGSKISNLAQRGAKGAYERGKRSRSVQDSQTRWQRKTDQNLLNKYEHRDPLTRSGQRKLQEAAQRQQTETAGTARNISSNDANEIITAANNNRGVIDINNLNQDTRLEMMSNQMITQNSNGDFVVNNAAVQAALISQSQAGTLTEQNYTESLNNLIARGASSEQLRRTNQAVMENAKNKGRYDIEGIAKGLERNHGNNMRGATAALNDPAQLTTYIQQNLVNKSVGELSNMRSSSIAAGTLGHAAASDMYNPGANQNPSFEAAMNQIKNNQTGASPALVQEVSNL